MAMGLCSASEFQEEKELAEVRDLKRGRGARIAIPDSLRKVIATEAINGTPVSEIVEQFNVSPSSISAYKHDATSTASYHEPNQELKKNNDEVREKIVTGARAKILSALDNITNDKLADAKLKDIASVARDMSAVIKNLEPATERDSDRPSQFIFYAPQFRKTDKDYAVIEVAE